MTMTSVRCAAPGILISAAVLLPFLGKSFTIDDTLFLRQAEHVLTDPLHPTAFEMVWSEAPVPRRVSQFMPSGPVMAYLLVPAVALGGAEWAAHLIQIVMYCVAVFAVVALGLRMGLTSGPATLAGVILAITPAALAMAGTAMPDVPAMALGVAGMERLYAWRKQRRWHQCLLATLAFALAPLARPHFFLMLVIGGLAIVGDLRRAKPRRRGDWLSGLPLVLAPLISVALTVLTRDPLGGTTDSSQAAWSLSEIRNWRINMIAFAIHWVLVLPLAIPWFIVRCRWLWLKLLVAISAAFVVVAVIGGADRNALWIVPVAGIGAAVLWDIVSDAWKRHDGTQGLLAAWLFIALPIALYPHMPSKFLLASAPAAALLIAGLLSRQPRGRTAFVAALTCALGLALSILILRADAAFAGLGRRAAREVIAPQVSAGKNVWFSGHWGFQWYAEKAGARCLTVTKPHPRPGDLVVSSHRAFGLRIYEFPESRPFLKRRLLGSISDATPGGRLMSTTHGAGFYSNGWGYLPWVWGSDEIERFDIWIFE